MADRIVVAWDDRIGPVCSIRILNRQLTLCLCHRRPDRSIPFFGMERYLCSRCLGMVLGGLAVTAPLAAGWRIPLLGSAILAVPLLIDGLTQASGWRTSTNLVRFCTGILFGAGISGLFW
jgi:uncharacterized membrane protein